MSIPRSTFFAAAFAALLTAGCQPPIVPGSAQPLAPPVQGAAFTIRVTNTLAVPMNVSYRYGADNLTVLGAVPSGQTLAFRVRDRGADDLEIRASDQQGGHRISQAVDMRSGKVVSVVLK